MIAAVILLTVADPKQMQSVNLLLSLLSLVAGVAFTSACWFHIKAKGRSGWWISALVLNLFGLLILILLKDHAPSEED